VLELLPAYSRSCIVVRCGSRENPEVERMRPARVENRFRSATLMDVRQGTPRFLRKQVTLRKESFFANDFNPCSACVACWWPDFSVAFLLSVRVHALYMCLEGIRKASGKTPYKCSVSWTKADVSCLAWVSRGIAAGTKLLAHPPVCHAYSLKPIRMLAAKRQFNLSTVC
jgi:hypothetical protein